MLKAIDPLQKANEAKGLYLYEKIASFNGSVFSVVQVADRTLDFHVHENSDELFYVLEGAFALETEEGLIPVKAGEFIVVPKGVRHRPVVKELTKFLMAELDGTLNKENSGPLYEA